MDEIINIRAVKHYDEHRGMPTRHPYVSILEGSQVIKPMPGKTGADWDSAPEQTGTLLMRQS